MLGALAGSAHVNLSVNRGQFSRDMALAERDFTRGAHRMDADARRAGVQISRGLGAGILGTVGPLYLLGRATRASWEELKAMRREAAQTEAVLASTGGVANVTAADVGRLAEAGLRLSGVDDQLIQRGANVLLTFKNIRNEVGAGNDVFTQSVEALLDMGVAMAGSSGEVTDLAADAIRLGRALNEPIRGMAALSRSGVDFDAKQREVIRRLVESGDVMAAQKIILAELRVEFGGSAAAAGEEFPAALNRAREAALGLGAGLLETLVPQIQNAAEEFEAWLQKLQEDEEMQRNFRENVEETSGAVIDLAKNANSVAEALGGWDRVIEILVLAKLGKAIAGWITLLRSYRAATLAAAAATAALGAAQARAGAGGALAGPAGKTRFLGLSRLGVGGLVAAGLLTADQVTGGHGLNAVAGAIGDIRGKGQSAATMAKLRKAAKGGHLSLDDLERIKQFLSKEQYWELRQLMAPAAPGEGRLGGPRQAPSRSTAPTIRTELSTSTQLQLAKAERAGDETKILRALREADREYAKLLRQAGLDDEERLALVQQQGSVRSQIRSIEAGNAADAKRAAEERKRAQEQAREDAKAERERAAAAAAEARALQHTKRVNALQAKVDRAEETEWLGDNIKSLARLRAYYRSYRDTLKKGSAEWEAASEDIRDVDGRIRGARQEQSARKDEIRLWRLQRKVRLAEETEGVQDDIRELKRLRAYWVEQRGESKKYSAAWRAAQDEIDSANAAIADAKNKNASTRSARDGMSLVNEFLRLQSEYGPNFFPDGSFGFPAPPITSKAGAMKAATTVVIQEFPEAPVDQFREMRYAQAAAGAVFDG